MKQTEAILGDMRFIPLKGVVLILILILTTSRVHAQYALGATGQMMIPTAEMQETGTFMGSANFLPEEVTPNKFNYPTMNYSVDMSLFSFVELTYRMTLVKMRTYNGRVGYHNQDRSNTIRIRPSVVTGGLRSCLGYACSHRSPLFCKDTNKPSAKAIFICILPRRSI